MNLRTLLAYAVEKNASDLHLTAGLEPSIRLDGELKKIPDGKALDAKTLENLFLEVMDDVAKEAWKENWSADFGFALPKLGRFRANVYQTLEGPAGAFRCIPEKIPELNTLGLPQVVESFSQFDHGLVLVTGPTGSGKTTTLAAMIELINQKEAKHIITVEDPIEFTYQSQKSLIHQREVGRNTQSFSSALREALREDPDIILVGEMRDLETIRLALTAAETGHLVFATLHTGSSIESIHRIIDVFPAEEKNLVRMMLADSLQAVIAQKLLPSAKKGRTALVEIMIANTAIRNLIRENKISQAASIIQTNASVGMQTFEQHWEALKKTGEI